MTTTSPSTLPAICSALLAAKAHSGKTFEDLAKVMGRDEVFVAAIFYGQAKPTSEDLDHLASALGGNTAYLTSDTLRDPVSGLGENYFPTRGGNWNGPPTDPLLYRLYEILVVYGLPLKHIIHEKTGEDAIVSAINFKAHVDVEDEPEGGGKRVVLTFSGKLLPYVKW